MVEEAGSVKSSMDYFKFLSLVPNSDGSLTRTITIPTLPAFEDENCIAKDIPLNQTHNTWFRFYRPRATSPNTKLPVIIHLHGGGFVLFSAATAPLDAFCRATAISLPAIVLSVEYRLAPEHRLPAAYDDAIEVLKWVRDNPGNEEWMRELGNPSRCFLFGTSAGGNIAYFAALMAQAVDLGPVKIEGVIMNQPFFGGILRTESELKLINDRILPLAASDWMWELSLPTGADRNHGFCNAVVVPEEYKAAVGLLPRCLVKGYGGDPLLDRQKEVVRMLKERGVHVVERFDEDGYHVVEMFDPTKSHALLMDIKNFVHGFFSTLIMSSRSFS